MKKTVLSALITAACLSFSICSSAQKFTYPEGSPVAIHGALQVKDLQLCDKTGRPVQLAGMSTMGWMWCKECYTRESIARLVQNWHCNVIRAAMYVEEGGYNADPEKNLQMMKQLIDRCGELGVYCIVDWHILTPGNPLHPAYRGVKKFFDEISRSYAGADHVIYELCNEPNGEESTWERIAQYANELIPMIHAASEKVNAPHPVILCGTPRWDQVVDAPVANGNRKLPYDNIMYTFHFYAATHTFYEYIYDVLGKVPVFCSEFGTVEATGNGTPDFDATDKWLLMFNGNNAGKQLVSVCNWSYCDKPETSAALYPGSCARQDWDNVQPSGEYMRRYLAVMNAGAKDSTILKEENRFVKE